MCARVCMCVGWRVCGYIICVCFHPHTRTTHDVLWGQTFPSQSAARFRIRLLCVVLAQMEPISKRWELRLDWTGTETPLYNLSCTEREGEVEGGREGGSRLPDQRHRSVLSEGHRISEYLTPIHKKTFTKMPDLFLVIFLLLFLMLVVTPSYSTLYTGYQYRPPIYMWCYFQSVYMWRLIS